MKLRFGLYILFSLIATHELCVKARGDVESVLAETVYQDIRVHSSNASSGMKTRLSTVVYFLFVETQTSGYVALR